jgi:hypothetical protein
VVAFSELDEFAAFSLAATILVVMAFDGFALLVAGTGRFPHDRQQLRALPIANRRHPTALAANKSHRPEAP